MRRVASSAWAAKREPQVEAMNPTQWPRDHMSTARVKGGRRRHIWQAAPCKNCRKFERNAIGAPWIGGPIGVSEGHRRIACPNASGCEDVAI